MADPLRLVLTCEHAGCEVPDDYRELFRPHAPLLLTHRGYDIGILPFAQKLAVELHEPLLAASMTRLLVDLNRSLRHPQLFSFITRSLPRPDRQKILDNYYHPHRQQVVQAIEKYIDRGERVLHIALHSFTPMYKGVLRRGDICLLYDPSRAAEKKLCLQWKLLLNNRLPEVCVRRNFPYRGNADALVTWLRRRYPASSYLGLELEINQRLPLLNSRDWVEAQDQLILSIKEILSSDQLPGRGKGLLP